MGNSLNIVVLPGLDGTGILLSDFAAAFTVDTAIMIINYPADTVMTYEDLAAYVRQRLPEDDYVLVGESFSGPLALRIASEPPPGLKGVVLGASFARLDMPAKRLLSGAAATFPPKILPMFALSFLLLGKWATSGNVGNIRMALQMVSAKVLSARAREALAVDLVAQGITVDCPTLLLQARHDRLIPRSAANAVGRICRNLRIESIDGPHFLFQVAQAACASAIQKFGAQLPDGNGAVR